MTFAQTLKKLRIAAGLTQEQLAHACGYSGQSRIGNYESSQPKARQPKPDELPVIARALGVSVGQLFGESQTLRLDPAMLAETHKACRIFAERQGRVFSVETDPERFMLVYQDRQRLSRHPTHDELIEFGAKLAEIMTPQGAVDGRNDGVPAAGTDERKVAGRGGRRKA